EAAAHADAENKAGESRERLARFYLANGMRLMDEGELPAALPWLAEALKHEADPHREEMHRVRLAAVLRQCPRLVQFWVHDRPVYHAEFSPDGRRIVIATGMPMWISPHSGQARVWDVVTGQ